MSAFAQLAGIAPQRIWEGVVAGAIHGERLTLAVIELEPRSTSPSTATSTSKWGSSSVGGSS